MVFFSAVTALLWVAAALLWAQVYRAPENTAIRFFAATLTLMALNFALNVAPVIRSPVGLLVAVNLIGLATGYLKIGFFMTVVHGSQAGRRLRRELALVVVVAVIAMLAMTMAPTSLRAVLPGREAATHPAGFVFSISIVAYLTYVSLRTVIWTRELLPQAPRWVLRVSLILIGLGACAHLVTSAASLFTTTFLFATASPASVFDTLYAIMPIFTALGFMGLLCGALVPIVAGVLKEVPLARQHRAMSRSLDPLWMALNRAFPGLALATRAPNATRKLYRRTVEILDGLVLLRAYYDDAVAARAANEAAAAGIAGAVAELRVDAAVVAEALREHEAGRPAQRRYRLQVDSGGDNWSADAARLVGLAEQFATFSRPPRATEPSTVS
ncbi:MAG: hypothetical protein EKK42_31700 [Pseudonocardiaceae bacterium]|nr:MAG: hypothetical protein EKK42_31700 [Pseudonocardiaceae bacterium]